MPTLHLPYVTAKSEVIPESSQMLTPTPALMQSIRRAFHKYGYASLTMVDMARECGFTRRSIYNYFRNKEEAFRFLIRSENEAAIDYGIAAGEKLRRTGGDAAAVFATIMDTRYGATRRFVETSPHTVELNAMAFMLCRDVMIEVAAAFQRQLADLVVALAEDGFLEIRSEFTPADIAQLLANGARGVNQALPPAALDELSKRYRDMCRAILFGCVVGAKTRRSVRDDPAGEARESGTRRSKTRGV